MSEMQPAERERLENYKEALRARIETLLNDTFEILENLPDIDDARYPDYLRITYELWANSMGVMDGLCCLRGVPQALRHRSMRHAIQHGKVTVLQRHQVHCSGCDAARDLEDEIDNVQ